MALASGFAQDEDALPIRTQARVLGATLNADQSTTFEFLHPQHYGHLVAAKGRYTVNGVSVEQGDGVAIYQEDVLRIEALEDCELVLVETRP